jgi:hypothetical protein
VNGHVVVSLVISSGDHFQLLVTTLFWLIERLYVCVSVADDLGRVDRRFGLESWLIGI